MILSELDDDTIATMLQYCDVLTIENFSLINQSFYKLFRNATNLQRYNTSVYQLLLNVYRPYYVISVYVNKTEITTIMSLLSEMYNFKRISRNEGIFRFSITKEDDVSFFNENNQLKESISLKQIINSIDVHTVFICDYNYSPFDSVYLRKENSVTEETLRELVEKEVINNLVNKFVTSDSLELQKIYKNNEMKILESKTSDNEVLNYLIIENNIFKRIRKLLFLEDNFHLQFYFRNIDNYNLERVAANFQIQLVNAMTMINYNDLPILQKIKLFEIFEINELLNRPPLSDEVKELFKMNKDELDVIYNKSIEEKTLTLQYYEPYSYERKVDLATHTIKYYLNNFEYYHLKSITTVRDVKDFRNNSNFISKVNDFIYKLLNETCCCGILTCCFRCNVICCCYCCTCCCCYRFPLKDGWTKHKYFESLDLQYLL